MKIWAEMTWKEIWGLGKDVLLILPVGSTEQHGERLPVGTDALFANYLAWRIAEEIPNSVLLPCLNYGMSWHHTAFPGTVSISGPVYTLVIADMLESLVKHGFSKILVVNGHGGNHDWIERAIAYVSENHPETSLANPTMNILKGGDFVQMTKALTDEDIVHAGAMETSMLAAIEPGKMKPASLVGAIPTEAKFGEGTSSPSEWKRKFPRGQKGDQTKADPEIGRQMIDFIFAKLLEAARKMAG